MSWAVPRIWIDEPAVVLGTGPSLTAAQVKACVGRARILAVNSAFLKVPEPERPHAWLHGCDDEFWEEWPEAFAWPGIKTTMHPQIAAMQHGVHLIPNDGASGLSDDPRCVRTGGSSAYQGVNMLYLAGARPIMLLGCDCRYDPETGEAHHVHQVRPGPQKYTFPEWIMWWGSIVGPLNRAGVQLWNCTPGSAIPENVIPQMDLEACLGLASNT